MIHQFFSQRHCLKAYTQDDYNNNKDGIQDNIKNFEAIKFSDGTVIGDSSYFNNSGESITSYEYTLNITATLTDTDGSESLSTVKLTLPDGVTIKGIEGNEINVNSGEQKSVVLVSSTILSTSELNSIEATVSSIESNGGEINTTSESILVSNPGETITLDEDEKLSSIYIGEGEKLQFKEIFVTTNTENSFYKDYKTLEPLSLWVYFLK